ncbi:MAG: hypothetical protein ACI9UN_005421, partial [Granulosicoccus sp.]
AREILIIRGQRQPKSKEEIQCQALPSMPQL